MLKIEAEKQLGTFAIDVAFASDSRVTGLLARRAPARRRCSA